MLFTGKRRLVSVFISSRNFSSDKPVITLLWVKLKQFVVVDVHDCALLFDKSKIGNLTAIYRSVKQFLLLILIFQYWYRVIQNAQLGQCWFSVIWQDCCCSAGLKLLFIVACPRAKNVQTLLLQSDCLTFTFVFFRYIRSDSPFFASLKFPSFALHLYPRSRQASIYHHNRKCQTMVLHSLAYK